MSASRSSSNSSEQARAYQLRKSCCLQINVTLCIHHLVYRLHDGWVLDTDRGIYNLPCWDLQQERLKQQ